MMIENRDWPNWEETMSAREVSSEAMTKRRVTRPRPGHTDLAGSLSTTNGCPRTYSSVRAPARNGGARRMRGLAKVFLRHFGIEVLSHTTAIGNARCPGFRRHGNNSTPSATTRSSDVSFRTSGPTWFEEIEKAQKDGDTIGGKFEVVARGVPTGLGSHSVGIRGSMDAWLRRSCASTP